MASTGVLLSDGKKPALLLKFVIVPFAVITRERANVVDFSGLNRDLPWFCTCYRFTRCSIAVLGMHLALAWRRCYSFPVRSPLTGLQRHGICYLPTCRIASSWWFPRLSYRRSLRHWMVTFSWSGAFVDSRFFALSCFLAPLSPMRSAASPGAFYSMDWPIWHAPWISPHLRSSWGFCNDTHS